MSRNSDVAMSAAPIGSPGWPLLAFSTASAERKRMALASVSCSGLLGNVGSWMDGGIGADSLGSGLPRCQCAAPPARLPGRRALIRKDRLTQARHHRAQGVGAGAEVGFAHRVERSFGGAEPRMQVAGPGVEIDEAGADPAVFAMPLDRRQRAAAARK